MLASSYKKARLAATTTAGACGQTPILIVGDEEIAEAKATNAHNPFLRLLRDNASIFQVIMRFLTLAPPPPADALIKLENMRERFGDPDAGLAFVHCCAVTLPMGRVLTPEVYFGPSYRPRITGNADPTIQEVARTLLRSGVANSQHLLHAVREASLAQSPPTNTPLVTKPRVVLDVLKTRPSSLWLFGREMSVECARAVLEAMIQDAHRYNQASSCVQGLSVSAQIYGPGQDGLLRRLLSTPFAGWFYYDATLLRALFLNTADRIGALASSFPDFFTQILTNNWQIYTTDAQLQAVYDAAPEIYRRDLVNKITAKLQARSVAELTKVDMWLDAKAKIKKPAH